MHVLRPAKVLALSLLVSLSLLPHAADAQEFNVDRPGSDYRNLDLQAPRWLDCQNMCTADARCLSWTYVKPGVQGPKARCWLKNKIPNPTTNTCCISGLKRPTSVGKQSYSLPTIGGVMVDYCAEIKQFTNGRLYRNGCGRDAAHAFCRRAGHKAATFWDIDSRGGVVYNTVHPGSLQRCSFNSSQAVTRCRGFRVIVCR
ncbi:MAG: PAN domain-containing protein [Methyloligellaceae bacterium]